MKTDALIAALAEKVEPTPRRPVVRALAAACLGGGVVAFIVLLAWLGLRPDMGHAMGTMSFWMKLGYTLWLSLAGLAVAARLARPGGRIGRAGPALAAALGLILLFGVIAVAAAPPERRGLMIMGHSWRLCCWRIAVIAAPVFGAVIVAIRGLAPTRLVLAGAAAGLLAGAVGATIYGLACQETSPMFVAVWYTLGVSLCAAVGALVGPRLLRW